MPEQPRERVEMSAEALAMLACPVCFGALRADFEKQHIVCLGCARGYPVVDGIPVLIAERAIAGTGPATN